MNRVSIAACLIVLLGFLGQAAGQEKQVPVVAVFDIENRGSPLSKDQLITLTDYLGTKLGERGMYRIIPRRDIHSRLTQVKKESFKECYDQSCQIEIGRELAAEYTISSSIGRVGKLCLITASLYDLSKAATSRTATARGPCTEEDLVNAIEEVADKLQGVQAEAKPEPEPKLTDLKTPRLTPPPTTYKPAPAGPMLGDTFSDLHLTFGYLVSTGGNMINPESVQFGVDLSLDFRLGSLFTLGPFVRFSFTDFFIGEASIRSGILLEATKKLFVHTYVLAGFTYETVALDSDRAYYWDLVGFHVRGGVGIKWMFSRDFGFCLDLVAGWSSGVAIESEVEGDDGQATEISTNLGMVVGW
jgi:hypothetical protein